MEMFVVMFNQLFEALWLLVIRTSVNLVQKVDCLKRCLLCNGFIFVKEA